MMPDFFKQQPQQHPRQQQGPLQKMIACHRLRRGSIRLLDNDNDDDTEYSTSSSSWSSSSLHITMPMLSLKRNISNRHSINNSSSSTKNNSNYRTVPPTSPRWPQPQSSQKKHRQQEQQPQPGNKNKRVVSFQHFKANKAYRNTITCREDCRDQWYTANDYAQFKSDAKLIAAEIIKREKHRAASPSTSPSSSLSSSTMTSFSYQGILQRTLEACRTHPFNTSSDSDDTDENADSVVNSSSSSILTKIEQQHLQRWLNIATMRLGLEGMTIREIGRDRLHRHKHIQKVVLQAQADIRAVQQQRKQQQQQQQPYRAVVVPSRSSNKSSSSSRLNRLSESQARHLKNVSQAVSHPSRLFAHEMARAAAAASSSSSPLRSAIPSSSSSSFF
jgi:hypothetical protein